MARYTAVILVDLDEKEWTQAHIQAEHITSGLAMDQLSVSLKGIIDNEKVYASVQES